MKHTHTTRWLVMMVAAAALLVPAVAGAGTIEGTVTGKKAKGPLVVYVKQASGTFQPTTDNVIDQHGMKFVPFVTPIVVGSQVSFKNSDKVKHNVFSPDHEGYNLGTWAPGKLKSRTFKKQGVYTQLCSLHPEMEAYILALQNPYFATTTAGTTFKIDGISDGKYELMVWGKKLKKKHLKKKFAVTVQGGKASVAIDL